MKTPDAIDPTDPANAAQVLIPHEYPLDGPALLIFVGLQASGKSSFYKAYLAPQYTLISKDLLRNNKRRQRRQLRLIEDALREGQVVVIDNTNPTPAERAPLIALAQAYNAPVIGYYFHSKLSDCMARNALREGHARVPDVGLFTTTKILQRPHPSEGFQQLFYVRLDDDEDVVGGFVIEDFVAD